MTLFKIAVLLLVISQVKPVSPVFGFVASREQCSCDTTGSISGRCDTTGSQCQCKQNVVGRRCDECRYGTFAFGPNGCTVCECVSAGSWLDSCDLISGQCYCHEHVSGRRCGQCEKTFWGFPDCQPCQCNGHADTCDQDTGACIACRNSTTGHNCGDCQDFHYRFPRSGTAGQPCISWPCTNGPDCGISPADICFRDSVSQKVLCSCQPGYEGRTCERCAANYFGSPSEFGGSCTKCDCNGHADDCDQVTGACIACRDSTTGHNCNHCQDFHYRFLRSGTALDPCKPCPCPNGPDSGIHHADSCFFDPVSQTVLCSCYPGYEGRNCERCTVNFFGSPNEIDGNCTKCDCHGSIEHTEEGTCDPVTGLCLNCQLNTDGFDCQNCVAGYYGKSTQQQCHRCVCNMLGTIGGAGAICDRVTGQCPCLPNVKGLECDSCELNHWQLASGNGCEDCQCDPTGVESNKEGHAMLQCNSFDGQCTCKTERLGRNCSEVISPSTTVANVTEAAIVEFGVITNHSLEVSIGSVAQNATFVANVVEHSNHLRIVAVASSAIGAILIVVLLIVLRYWIRERENLRLMKLREPLPEVSNSPSDAFDPKTFTTVTVVIPSAPAFSGNYFPYVSLLDRPRLMPVIPWEQLKFIRSLGNGCFGSVVLQKATFPIIGTIYVAVKSSPRYPDMVRAEMDMMASLPLHINVLKLLAVSTDEEGSLHLITQHCVFGTMHQLLGKPGNSLRHSCFQAVVGQAGDNHSFTMFHLYSWAYQLVDGMHCLASHNVVHSDLKLENILLSQGFLLKISDFGLTNEATRIHSSGQVMIPREAAPEAREFGSFTTKSDVYSLGIILWFLYEFSVADYAAFVSGRQNGYASVPQPRYAFELIRLCLQRIPHLRPTFGQCLERILDAIDHLKQTDVNILQEIQRDVQRHGEISVQIENALRH